MALLGTYGGEDDVLLYKNRILAEQAGALIPEGEGKTVYPKPVCVDIPVVNVSAATEPDEFLLDIGSLGTVKYSGELLGVQVAWCASKVGTTSDNNTVLTTFGIDESVYTINTIAYPTLVKPYVLYAKVTHIVDGVDFHTYSNGVKIPADPVVRTASTRTRKAVTA